jgi:hypothetical protein
MATIPGLDQAVEGFRISYRCVVDPAFDCPLPPPATLEADGAEVAKDDAVQPLSAFSLQQNVPNPFNPTTTISFVVPDGGADISLRIYDSAGRLVRTLVNGYETSGTKEVSWSGENDLGQPVASGVYFYRLSSSSYSKTKKMILLK